MHLALPVFLVVVLVYVQYWVIRYAVRHALADADERRSREAAGGRSIGS